MRGIIFAAGKSSRLGSLTTELPKICLPLEDNKTILDRTLTLVLEAGIKDLIIVTGHAQEKIAAAISVYKDQFNSLELLYNEHYADRNNIYTAYLIKDLLDAQTIIFNSDIVYDPAILAAAVKRAKDSKQSFLVVDDSKPLVDEDMKVLLDDSGKIIRINKKLDNQICVGEYIGVLRLAGQDLELFKNSLEKMIAQKDFNKYYEDALDRITSDLDLGIVSTAGKLWTEIDFLEDYKRAQEIVKELEKIRA